MESALEVTIRTQGEIWFASRELGRLADTESYFLNTALYYAFGLASGRYIDRSFNPTYLDDTAEIAQTVYVSPAAPIGRGEGTANRITSTYNTNTDDYATVNYSAEKDPDAGKNLPTFGRRRVLGHGNALRCLLLGRGIPTDELANSVPGYIRLGKKRGKAKLAIERLNVDSDSGEFSLGHPIGVYDSDRMPTGNLITKRMRPTPLIVQATYEGEHVVLRRTDGANEHNEEDREDAIRLPSDVEFLKMKR